MNTALQKDIYTEEERRNVRKKHLLKYMSRHKTMCVTLSDENDSDILDWLDRQENRSESIRKALKIFIGMQNAISQVQDNGNKNYK